MLPRALLMTLSVALIAAACSGPQQNGLPGVTESDRAELAAHDIAESGVRCNGFSIWETALRSQSKAGARDVLDVFAKQGVALTPEQDEALHDELTDMLMWRYVRAIVVSGNNNNLGVVALRGQKTASGAPLLVFRTGFTPAPEADESCYKSLIETANVRHVINLYDGDIPTADLEQSERSTIEAAGGTYDTVRDAGGDIAGWRDLLRKNGEDPEARARAQAAVAELINTRILAPGGNAPRGNVHIHCGGGMHRTGMVVGVLEHCVNKASKEQITAAYRHHVSWKSDDEPGGFEGENLEFIESFDCSLLKL